LTEKRKNCAGQLFQQLCDTGFCRIRGTGVPRETCEQALSATQAFLQDADENVRRSCLAKDRARRGYSPMNAENFASLIGEHAPNDLVRKFRIGPIQEDATQNSLLQPNVWPSVDVWDAEAACSFRAVVEEFYTASCDAAKALVLAICEGILLKYPELEDSFRSLMNKKLLNQKTTSILTLLGYRPGTRHKGKNKGPLVAAHTDVGVITMLLFTGRESCASVQRKNKNDGWDDVTLPYEIPQDPIFIVHVADCLSALSDGKVPSTVHRVIARHDSEVPRNCCALFVGLDPNASLTIQGEKISYEEWRKRRIANAQTSLKTLQKQ
jgi:isopenicillin N synthase-like dioxygenase